VRGESSALQRWVADVACTPTCSRQQQLCTTQLLTFGAVEQGGTQMHTTHAAMHNAHITSSTHVSCVGDGYTGIAWHGWKYGRAIKCLKQWTNQVQHTPEATHLSASQAACSGVSRSWPVKVCAGPCTPAGAATSARHLPASVCVQVRSRCRHTNVRKCSWAWHLNQVDTAL
jgi:hypothetical protein